VAKGEGTRNSHIEKVEFEPKPLGRLTRR
jgi:hypothetical protein